jgi:hypothetical protein
MTYKTVTVGIAPDAIEEIAKVPMDRAVEELIWNAIDAEATHIELTFYENTLKGIDRLVVSDNGHGIPIEQTETIFEHIGGSPKRLRRRSPNLDRPYHGKEGKGRYKAFSIGSNIEWHSRTQVNGSVQSFSVHLGATQLRSARIGSPEPCDGTTGCDVIITDLRDGVNCLRSDGRRDALTHRLAPYLMAHPEISIIYDGERFDVARLLQRDKILSLEVPANDESPQITAQLRVLEWNIQRKPTLFLCDEHGVAFDEVPPGTRETGFSYSAYLLSDYIRLLHEDNRLALDELSPGLRQLKEAARDTIRDYFRERRAEDAATVSQRMQAEGIYPYTMLPATPVQRAERQVFDICAATIHTYLPEFEKAEKNARQFTYRLLREALESNPTTITVILKEVLKLTDEQQGDLVYLLQKVGFAAIIQTAKTIADRLAFINGLEQILHEKTIRSHLKERTQLQRILVDELWIFGDEYLLGGDDVSLKTVLAEHLNILGLPSIDPVEAKDEIADLNDVPDLLLWRQYLRGRKDEYEHLVVELKRPTVNISQNEIQQVKRYATKVLGNRHFDKNKTHWTFVVLSDDIADDAIEEVKQRDRKPGQIFLGDYHEIWVRRWSEVIHDARIRLNFVQEKLNFAVEDNVEGREYLKKKFAHLLPEAVK